MVKEKESKLLGLDLARAVAAMCVFIGHYRSTCFPPYSQLKEPGFIETIFYGFTSLQHEAVIVFFVLSGYLVGGSVLKAGKIFSIKKYFLARLVRLWIVLLPALTITAIFDFLTKKIYPDILIGIFYEKWSVGPNLETGISSSPLTLFGNILFLQTILCPIYGSNGPLWSLANEFWYYLIFPLLLGSLGKIGRFTTNKKILSSVFLVCIFWILPYSVLFGFLAWLIGVAVYLISPKLSLPNLQNKTLFSIAGLFFLFRIFVFKRTDPNLIIFEQVFIALSFAPVCSLMPHVSGKKMPFMLRKMITFFADTSYTLYAIHFPILMFMMALLFKINNVGYPSLFIFIVMVLFSFLFCLFFWYLFERNTNSVREYIISKIKTK